MSSHAEVVSRFASRKINRLTQTVQWTGNNVYCRDNILYSYGSHFPLAIYLGENIFLKNNDKYSSSTSCHQSITERYCKGPSVSRNLLANNGIDFEKIKLKNIVCWQPFEIWFVERDQLTGFCKLEGSKEFWPIPELGRFHPYYKRDKNTIVRGTWRIPSAVLFQVKGKQYFCSSDTKDKRFVQRFKKKVTTIKEAFDLFDFNQVEWATWLNKETFKPKRK